jgi:hypothetical protein
LGPSRSNCLGMIDRWRLIRRSWLRPPPQRAASRRSRTSSREQRWSTAARSDACTSLAHRCARSPKPLASATSESPRSSMTEAFAGGDDAAARNRRPSGSVPSAGASSDRSANSSRGRAACTSATPASWRLSVSRLPVGRRRIRGCSLSPPGAGCSARSAGRHGSGCKLSCRRRAATSTGPRSPRRRTPPHRTPLRRLPSATSASGSAARSSRSNFARTFGVADTPWCHPVHDGWIWHLPSPRTRRLRWTPFDARRAP